MPDNGMTGDALESEYMRLDAEEKRAKRMAVLYDLRGEQAEAMLERCKAWALRQQMREMHQRELAARRDG